MAAPNPTRDCLACSKPFEISSKSKQQIFCSRKCFGDSKSEPPSTRFAKHVTPSSDKECWVWHGSKSAQGYGVISIRNRSIRAHRLSWELHNGPIPKGPGYHGFCVCHRCDNPPCVNPAHLFLGSIQDNLADMILKGRARHPKNRITPRGEANWNARLKESDVRAIRSSIGESRRAIATRFGVCLSTVSAIRNFKIWTHIASELPPWQPRSRDIQ